MSLPSTRRRTRSAKSDTTPAVTQVSGAETGDCLAETGAEAAAAAVSRLVVHPQVPRGYRSVQHRRGLLDDADGLGRRDDAAVGVQRRRLVSTIRIPSDLYHTTTCSAISDFDGSFQDRIVDYSQDLLCSLIISRHTLYNTMAAIVKFLLHNPLDYAARS